MAGSLQSSLMDESAIYQIRLGGLLEDSLASSLWGMTCLLKREDDLPITVIEGPVIDQAALLGILNALYNMGHPVLSIAIIFHEDQE